MQELVRRIQACTAPRFTQSTPQFHRALGTAMTPDAEAAMCAEVWRWLAPNGSGNIGDVSTSDAYDASDASDDDGGMEDSVCVSDSMGPWLDDSPSFGGGEGGEGADTDEEEDSEMSAWHGAGTAHTQGEAPTGAEGVWEGVGEVGGGGVQIHSNCEGLWSDRQHMMILRLMKT